MTNILKTFLDRKVETFARTLPGRGANAAECSRLRDEYRQILLQNLEKKSRPIRVREWRKNFYLSDADKARIVAIGIEGDVEAASQLLDFEDLIRYVLERFSWANPIYGGIRPDAHTRAMDRVEQEIAWYAVENAAASAFLRTQAEIRKIPYTEDEEDLLSTSPAEYFERQRDRESMASGRMATHPDADV